MTSRLEQELLTGDSLQRELVRLRAENERLYSRIDGYQGSRDHAINLLAVALQVEPDTVRAVEYYAQQASETIERLRSENERLEKLVYVPGVWVCAKCKLSLVSTLIDVSRGLFAANKEPQQCPNGCGPLWRKTERDAGNELCIRVDEQSAENDRLRQELAATEKRLDVVDKMQVENWERAVAAEAALATARRDAERHWRRRSNDDL